MSDRRLKDIQRYHRNNVQERAYFRKWTQECVEMKKRVKKAQEWIDARIQEERKRLVREKAYIDNQEYFDRLRIKPLLALKHLVSELHEKYDAGLWHQKFENQK